MYPRMKLRYFRECYNFDEVNEEFLRLLTDEYRTIKKRNSKEFKAIQREYEYLESHNIEYDILDELKDLKHSTTVLERLKKGQLLEPVPAITPILEIKPEPLPEKEISLPEFNMDKWLDKELPTFRTTTAIYFAYLKKLEITKSVATKEQLKKIQVACGYKEGWVHYKSLELNI